MKKTNKDLYVVVDTYHKTQTNPLSYLECLRTLKANNYRKTVQIRNYKGKYVGDGYTLKATCKAWGI